MHAVTVSKQESETGSPGLNASTTSPADANGSKSTSNGSTATENSGAVKPTFPPPKTDKPRPHICQTCTRSFARLEHLKRHERSHTKEKPFECPECTRCFARRDLLLRHQQKLHMTNTTTRPRAGRRESVAGANGNGRVRKNSVANINVSAINGAASNQVRPRANTISHVDLSSLGLIDHQGQIQRMDALGLGMNGNNSIGALPGVGQFDYRGMSNSLGNHGNIHGLPKLDTQHINHMDMTNALRTAPPQASFAGFDLDQLFTPNTTINPAALHFGSAGQIHSSNIPFGLGPGTNQQVPVDDDFGWMRNWGMLNGNDYENAVDESSPSRISSGDSPSDFPESMSNSQAAMPMQNDFQWQPQDLSLHQTLSHSSTGPFQLDGLGNGLPSLDQQHGTLSPRLQDHTPTGDAYFQQAMMQQHNNGPAKGHPSQVDIAQAHGTNFFGNPISNVDSDSPSMSSPSMTSSTSARQSSMTSISTDSITESTRQALLNSLSQPSLLVGHSQRKYSQPAVSSPLSAGAGGRTSTPEGITLPSRADLQRYIEAFMQYAHPHLPITHIATVTFNPMDLVSPPKGSPSAAAPSPYVTANGPQCLILGMAAIGALYEYDHVASKSLFEAAKKMISLYLEDRRKADMASAINREATHSTTPLWLVQAMLLNVIYGHHCGDRLAAEISSNHIAALVSLARSANLQTLNGPHSVDGDTAMGNGDHGNLQSTWIKWKIAEEQKRCFFGIFILSSLLTIAYNQTPSIMNSEILLDLPCDEELYEAPSAEEWHARGGLARVEENSLSFADALSSLLTANQRVNNFNKGNFGMMSNNLPVSEIKPSTFGSLVLINALHNYIWETRSRHRGREWTMQETDAMIANIEPALNAWMAAWKANERHTLERPNPFGLGPLAADSIPLLDLAYVRLYVNLGRTSEAFWSREFNKMAHELNVFNDFSEGSSDPEAQMEAQRQSASKSSDTKSLAQRRMSQATPNDQASRRRELHLRKAAAYAADALTVACNFNLTYSDPHAHELPIQAAICFLDCAHVLAEWSATVQERTGQYIGVLGRDSIDFADIPAVMLLAPEDMEMLHKLDQIYKSMKDKHNHQENLLSMNPNNFQSNLHNGVDLDRCGYGSKIMRVTAMMLEKAVIWPITHVMAAALETQAGHMDRRALRSVGELQETAT